MFKRVITLAVTLSLLMVPITSYAWEFGEVGIFDGGTIELDRNVQEPLFDVYTSNGFHFKTNKVFYPADKLSLSAKKNYYSKGSGGRINADIQTHSHSLETLYVDETNVISEQIEPGCDDECIIELLSFNNPSADVNNLDDFAEDIIDVLPSLTLTQIIKESYVVEGKVWWVVYDMSTYKLPLGNSHKDIVNVYLMAKDGDNFVYFTIDYRLPPSDSTFEQEYNTVDTLVRSIVRTFEPV